MEATKMHARVLKGVVVVSIGALAATSAVAWDNSKSGDADTKVVCKREASVGTRLAGRTCLTRAQWKERERWNKDTSRDIIERSERDSRNDAYVPGERPL
jgi:hypothetical protein